MNKNLPAEFFEALGEPKPGAPFDILDSYRFDLCLRNLRSGSVLDVGAYLGDLLKMVIRDGREYYGTEVNKARVDLVNKILGSQFVRLAFRNGDLSAFESNFVDNVVCMETVEHIADHKLAVEELCRVAKKRVVITVPFREQVQQTLCIHCNTHTPHHGHVHRYDLGSFDELIPEGWHLVHERAFGKRSTRILSKVLPKTEVVLPLLQGMDGISPLQGKWLLVVLDRKLTDE